MDHLEAPLESLPPRRHDSEVPLPWLQLRMTGREFQDAIEEMRGVFDEHVDPANVFATPPAIKKSAWARETRAFIDSNRLAQPKRPGQASHVSADRACRFLFNWVEQAKTRRRDAERQRQSNFFAQGGDPSASLNQLYCKDIVILLTCILGLQNAAELRRLTEVGAFFVLLSSLLHRLFYAPPAGFSFEVFREEAMGLLETIGRRFDVEFDDRKV